MSGATAPALDPYRLPRHAIPRRYELTLEPDLDRAVFGGQVRIELAVGEPTAELVLNAADLEIESAEVDGQPAAFRLDPASERLVVTPVAHLTAGDHMLDLRFRGTLNDQLRGFYRSTYRTADGAERVIATSQMQSTDCRRVFPCWDEPDFKAVFGVSLVVPADLVAVSNGREIARESLADGRVLVRFADTMIMSSYLVAFVVGPLETTPWIDADGVPVRLVHVPGKGALVDFALEVTVFSLRWFQRYYGIPYPGDKLELLALPDFAAGAMENLGCITFRENMLLLDPATSTQMDRQVVADTVAHEIAHMWFGDLVTMDWWNGIWLNEAFATFIEIAVCDAFRPEWERWTTFGLERSMAFETDSLSSTRPVEYEVRSPADCEGMFDVLTYQKGGALLRMLEQYLGEDRFRDGVRHYLRVHSYANTDTSDLWDAIEHTSGEPVRRMMDSWIWQPGYPLVSIRREGDEFVITQQRFSFDLQSNDTTLWAVPVAVRIGSTTQQLLLDTPFTRIPAADGPIVLNAGGHGFFRTWYSDELIALIDRTFLGSLSTVERFVLADDAYNAVVAGLLSFESYLDFVERFADERNPGVWESIAIGLRSARRLLDDPAAVEAYQRRVAALVGPALAELGEPVEGEGDLTAKLRGLLLKLMAVQAADPDARRRARAYDAAWAADPTSVDAELAAVSATIIAATGDAADYDRTLDRAMHGATPQVQVRHLYALAEFPDAELLQRTVEFAMSDRVKTQNAPFLLRAAMGNREHGASVWKAVRSNWAALNDRFPRNTIVRMVETVQLLDRPELVTDIQAFFAEHPIEQGAKTLQQILERQRINAAVRQRSAAPLERSLAGDRRRAATSGPAAT